MADLTYDQLTATTSVADTDLVAVYVMADSLLKKLEFSVFKAAVATALGSSFLTVSNNLSDLGSSSAARSNLGLGTSAVLSASSLFQVANNFSEVANAATARTNIGAAASDAPVITSGMTFSGSTKIGVQAIASTAIDVSLSEMQTKSISANTTFTFTGVTAAKGQGFALLLTISSAAVPAWPASVDWNGASDPSSSLGNGTHLLTFLTFDGGTTWLGNLIGRAYG